MHDERGTSGVLVNSSHPISMKTSVAHIGRVPFVQHDEPTLPDLPEPPTLLGLRRRKPRGLPPPMWPVPREREQLPAARGRSPFGWVITTALGASAVLLLSLLSLLGVINLTSRTGIFAPSRPTGQSAPGVSTAGPTPT